MPLIELIRSKQKGMPVKPQPTHRQTNVINLMDALRRSVEGEPKARRAGRQEGRSQEGGQSREPSAPKAARKGKARMKKAG